jgi:peptidoglycan/xylan/chitin deacetylase (PgdA/CDA1 family)
MSRHTPNVYTDLKPFRGLFAEGLPILTYHKLGPRPRGVRFKSLYVNEPLFARQLAELRAAGYASGSLDDAAAGPPPGDKRVVITFDDGFVNVLEHGLRPLADSGFKAMQYIIAGAIGGGNDWDVAQGEVYAPLMDRAQIGEWLAAGHAIGSHSLGHRRLSEIPVEQAREEIVTSKKKLEDLFGIPIHHFCYPYGAWNPQVRDLVMEAGYASACTTDHGVNAGGSAFELRRIGAGYKSWGLRAMRQRLFR